MSLKKLIDLDLLDRFLDKVKALIPSAATNNPYSLGTAAVGSSNKYAREDHVHPSTGLVTDIQYNPTSASIRKVKNGVTSDVVDVAILRDALGVFSLDADGVSLSANNNLDDFKTPGNYYCISASIAEAIVNSPPDKEPFKLVVIKTGPQTSYVCQLAFTRKSDYIYYRFYKSTWSDWKTFNIEPASADPLMNAGTASVGTSLNYAREDHVHPRDSKVFSLMYETEITANSDLDTYTTPGNYFCGSATNAQKIANSPAVIAYKLVVVRIVSAARYYQIAFPNGAPNIYIRYYSGSAWTDWINFRDANKVNGHTVESDVPANAIFTDTTYTPANAAPGKVASASSVGTSTNYARQDHTHGIDLASGDSNGQVKIAGSNISVKGLKSLAYADSVTKVNGHTVESDVPANAVFTDTISSGYCTTASDVDTKQINLTNMVARSGSLFEVLFTNENTYTGKVYLKIANNMSQELYLNGIITSSTNYSFPAGKYLVYDSGTAYYIRTDSVFPIKDSSIIICESNGDSQDKTLIFSENCTNFFKPLPNYDFFIFVCFIKANSYSGLLKLKLQYKYSSSTIDLYINGEISSATNCTIPAGIYPLRISNTKHCDLRTDHRLPVSIIGDATTVNGHTVESDVPANINWSNICDLYRTDLTFVTGSIASSSGANTTSGQAKRNRTDDYYPIDDPGYGFDIDIPDTFRMYIYYYNKSKAFLDNSGGWLTGYQKITASTVPENAKYVRFVLALVSDANFTPSNIPRVIYFRKRLYKE